MFIYFILFYLQIKMNKNDKIKIIHILYNISYIQKNPIIDNEIFYIDINLLVL